MASIQLVVDGEVFEVGGDFVHPAALKNLLDWMRSMKSTRLRDMTAHNRGSLDPPFTKTAVLELTVDGFQ